MEDVVFVISLGGLQKRARLLSRLEEGKEEKIVKK